MKKQALKQFYVWLAVILIALILFCTCSSCTNNLSIYGEAFTNDAAVQYAESRADIYWEIPGFLTPEECDQLRKDAINKGLVESLVLSDDNQNIADTRRKSEQVWFNKLDNNSIIEKIRNKSVELSGQPLSHFEDVQVVRYGVGGKYEPHYDSCNKTDVKTCHSDNPRKMTVLIYLNDDFECGGTSFPRLSKTVKPEKGKALVFFVSNENGLLYEDALHGGDPICKGEKWIATQWVHVKPYNP